MRHTAACCAAGGRGLHARITSTLEDRFPEIVLAQPALLAQHCVEAGLAEKAVAYWLKAGQRAVTGSAMTEAVVQLRKGLEVLTGLPDGPRRQQQELALQTILGSALGVTAGLSAANVKETLSRARDLAEHLDRPEYLSSVILGQCLFHHVRAEHRVALALGEQLEQIGQAQDDTGAQLMGRLLQGVSNLYLGELAAARALLERCIGLADPAHRTVRGLSFDPFTQMLAYQAQILACLGYIDQARSRMDDALSEARRLEHVHSLAGVLGHANRLDWFTRSAMVHSEEMMALVTEHGFPHYLGFALGYRGRSLIHLGKQRKASHCSHRGWRNFALAEGSCIKRSCLPGSRRSTLRAGSPCEARTGSPRRRRSSRLPRSGG